jgi:hypothetical protein
MFKKIFEDMKDLGWTLAGTGLVLITLSGDTLKWGLWMSGAALLMHFIVLLGSKGD